MGLMDKLTILADAAKYDAAWTGPDGRAGWAPPWRRAAATPSPLTGGASPS